MALLASSARADQPAAEFKGYIAIDRILKERVIRAGQSFELASYLEEKDESDSRFYVSGSKLYELVGVYPGAELNSAFRNGQPNVVNMVIWHLMFSGLAHDIATLCTADAAFAKIAQPEVVETLRPLCAWPAPEARANDVLLGLWTALLLFDAPQEEFEAWRAFFQGPVYEHATAAQAIEAMALSALSNPYFLLRN